MTSPSFHTWFAFQIPFLERVSWTLVNQISTIAFYPWRSNKINFKTVPTELKGVVYKKSRIQDLWYVDKNMQLYKIINTVILSHCIGSKSILLFLMFRETPSSLSQQLLSISSAWSRDESYEIVMPVFMFGTRVRCHFLKGARIEAFEIILLSRQMKTWIKFV